MKNRSNSAKELGNTNPTPCKQISCAKRWCFTYNNYPNDWKENIVPILEKCGKYCIGEEIGETGTPHLQGYIEFNVKCRPKSVLHINNIHWEKCKGSRIQNLNYCKKNGIYYQNFYLEYKCKIDNFFEWQKTLLSIINKEPNDRDIHWIWEPTGCAGKTTFQKYLHSHYDDVIVLSGKGHDMKNGVVKFIQNNDKHPKLVLINIPRSSHKFVSYSGIEEIKDMFFFSGKYESDNVNGPNPHVLVFSNSEPERDFETGEYLISNDRLKITRI